MLRELFEKQRDALEFFFRHVEIDAAENVFRKLLDCRGVVFFSGVGKSAHIAAKIAATFSSTGTRAMYLSTEHALHGDLGVVTSQDLWVALSKSGESQELLHLLPHIQAKGAYAIAWVSREESRLSRQADLSMTLPVAEELCPYDLAPTSSSAVQLLFGDCIAIALMQAKKHTPQEFAVNHPAGFLGRKLSLKVSDLMLQGSSLPLCHPEDQLLDVLADLSAKRCGCLLVCSEELFLQGIFTDGDLRRALQKEGSQSLQKRLKDLMTLAPLTTSPSLSALDAMRQMQNSPERLVTVLPVLEGRKVVGLLRMHEVVQAGLY